jgi:polysaccharide biosynthesis/export protein
VYQPSTLSGSKMLRKLSAAFVAFAFLAACDEAHTRFPVTAEKQASLPQNVVVTRLDVSNVHDFSPPSRNIASQNVPDSQVWNYRIGVGDILSIDVFDHPELTLPAGPMRSAVEAGFRVTSEGTFFYPFVGQVQAAGRVPEEIRVELQERLSTFIPSPQIQIRVAAFNSQAIVVAGAVEEPNRQALTTIPLTLLEAVNAAGGLRPDADPARVTLQRRGKTYNINFANFLGGGQLQNNPILINGDVISVPRRRLQEVFLLGEIISPATLDLFDEEISLTQAVARQGGLRDVRADARGIFVFRRGQGSTINVYQLDTSTPSGYVLGTKFLLAPDDVVYVTRSPLQRWNDTISAILPSVTAVGAVNTLAE